MSQTYKIDIKGFQTELPILQLDTGIKIGFFNLHGNPPLTEHCGKELAKLLTDAEVLLTVETKGFELTHVVARELNMPRYAAVRKTKKLYIQDGVSVACNPSATTNAVQNLFLSQTDVDLIKGKKVTIIDDVISTGASLNALEEIVRKSGATVACRAFVLAEGDAVNRKDIIYLAPLPLF